MTCDLLCLPGALVDSLGDYKYLFYMCGIILVGCGLFFFIMHYYNYKKLEEEKDKSASVETRTPEEEVELKPSPGDKVAYEADG